MIPCNNRTGGDEGGQGRERRCNLSAEFLCFPTNLGQVSRLEKYRERRGKKKCEKIVLVFNDEVLNSKDDFPFRFV